MLQLGDRVPRIFVCVGALGAHEDVLDEVEVVEVHVPVVVGVEEGITRARSAGSGGARSKSYGFQAGK